MLSAGLSSYNAKLHIPSDISTNDHFLPPENFKMQSHLDTINKWTESQKMLLNKSKTKYLIVNFCSTMQFQTRLTLKNSLLEQVNEVRLLGVILSDLLKWHSNADPPIKNAFKRMQF